MPVVLKTKVTIVLSSLSQATIPKAGYVVAFQSQKQILNKMTLQLFDQAAAEASLLYVAASCSCSINTSDVHKFGTISKAYGQCNRAAYSLMAEQRNIVLVNLLCIKSMQYIS